MNEDREIMYAAGELNEAELQAFEQSLSDGARYQADSLKSAFSALKDLKGAVPAPQISFDRVRNAIEAAPAPASTGWKKWLVFATPVAAACALAIVMTRSNGTTVAPQPMTQPDSVAKVTPPVKTETPDKVQPDVAPAPKPAPTLVAAAAEPAPTRRIRRSNKRRPIAIASVRDFPRASEGIINGTPKVAPQPTVTLDRAPEPDATEAAVTNQEPIVVVSPTTSAETGANAAIEVSKQGNDVLGG